MEAISLVVPTRDRPADLQRALGSYLANAGELAEIIVVDQSARDDTRTLLAGPLAHPKIRYVRCADRGASIGRNAGLAAARSPLVGFTDDDCLLPAGWARDMSAELACPGIGAVFGTVEAEPFDSSVGHTPELRLPTQVIAVADPQNLPCVMSANMAARREALIHIDGFDPCLGAGVPLQAAEDVDVAYRLLRAGHRVALRSEPAVVHFGFRTYASGASRAVVRATHVGMAAFYGKHIRAGDGRAARTYARYCLDTARRVLGNVWERRHPIGVSRLTCTLLGMAQCFRYGVDRERRMFVAPRG